MAGASELYRGLERRLQVSDEAARLVIVGVIVVLVLALLQPSRTVRAAVALWALF